MFAARDAFSYTEEEIAEYEREEAQALKNKRRRAAISAIPTVSRCFPQLLDNGRMRIVKRRHNSRADVPSNGPALPPPGLASSPNSPLALLWRIHPSCRPKKFFARIWALPVLTLSRPCGGAVRHGPCSGTGVIYGANG